MKPRIKAPTLLRDLACFAAMACLSASAWAMGSAPAPQQDEKTVLERIRPVAHIEFSAAEPASGDSASAGKSGAEVVKTLCSACHEAGVAGAPKIGDKAAWAPRLQQGLDGLVKSATAGKGGMPPKGGGDLSTTELARAIVFMANKSGANFKEPASK